MSVEMPRIVTAEEVAEQLRSTTEAVVAEFETGRLRGFQIGGEWRTTLPDLFTFIGASNTPSPLRTGRSTATDGNLLQGIEIEWTRTDPFSHRWPTRADEPDCVEEHADAFEGLVSKDGRVRRNKKLLIGLTTREAAGMDRRRATVFLARTGSRKESATLYPLVEFAGANDYETSQLLASVIKLSNRKQLRPGDPIPPEYRGFETAVYSDIVVGPYASNCLAVVVREDDLDSMARHALVRLKWSRNGRYDEFDS